MTIPMYWPLKGMQFREKINEKQDCISRNNCAVLHVEIIDGVDNYPHVRTYGHADRIIIL